MPGAVGPPVMPATWHLVMIGPLCDLSRNIRPFIGAFVHTRSAEHKPDPQFISVKNTGQGIPMYRLDKTKG